jgi:hypothetical protein
VLVRGQCLGEFRQEQRHGAGRYFWEDEGETFAGGWLDGTEDVVPVEAMVAQAGRALRKKGADHYWCGDHDQGDVWFVDKPIKNDLHPTMKPVELVERALRNSSKSRDIVLDPFDGSGTSLIACERTGRQARLIELDPRYCDVIVGRWQG